MEESTVEDSTWEDVSFIQKHPQLIACWGKHLSKGEGHVKPINCGALTPKWWPTTLVLLFYWCRLLSFSYSHNPWSPIYMKEICSFESSSIWEFMWCIRRLTPRSGLFIQISLFSKAWSTYFEVFMLFGYLLHNTISNWKELVFIPNNESVKWSNNLFGPPWFTIKTYASAILNLILGCGNLNIIWNTNGFKLIGSTLLSPTWITLLATSKHFSHHNTSSSTVRNSAMHPTFTNPLALSHFVSAYSIGKYEYQLYPLDQWNSLSVFTK